MNNLRTSAEWLSSLVTEIHVLDYDGWDRVNFNYSFYEELISSGEFQARLMRCTIQGDIMEACDELNGIECPGL